MKQSKKQGILDKASFSVYLKNLKRRSLSNIAKSTFVSPIYLKSQLKSFIFRYISKSKIKKQNIHKKIVKKNMISLGPKIVAIGGGTGLSTMLRGLKYYSENITAVVTVADDGGGSGMLRHDLGMLPPGDIRNCILALADTEPIMEQLLQYRFTEGSLKGQSFGNLFLAAMNGISANFEHAVRRMSDVLAVTGRVLPVTEQDVQLCALLDNGVEVCGESKIAEQKKVYNSCIKKVFLKPTNVKPLDEVITSIEEADIVVMGPGSLYTSILPNLIVEGVAHAIRKSKALKVYICNVMTQPGETDEYTAYDHVIAIEEHAGKGLMDYCIVNTQPIPDELLKKYAEDEAESVVVDEERFKKTGIKLIKENLLGICNGYIRHNTDYLAELIMKLVLEEVLHKDKRRRVECQYLYHKIRSLHYTGTQNF